MSKLKNFEQFEQGNLAAISGGVSYGYRDTTYPNGGADEDLLTNDGGTNYMDGLYNCDNGSWDWGGMATGGGTSNPPVQR